MRVYYNEFDKKKCAMLSQLMKDGRITKGDIDDRSIRDVQPSDVKGYNRAHFFAGIGLWDYALNLAGWAEDTPVWTGSCPCQPFSTAGRQRGKADDRHLWPEWFRLIRECRPSTVFGEQVANAVSKGWLGDVYQGMEAEGYAIGSAVLPACSVGAPHKRDRLWFVAQSTSNNDRGSAGEFPKENEQKEEKRPRTTRYAESCCSSTMGNTACEQGSCDNTEFSKKKPRKLGRACFGSSFWSSGVWLNCPDGKQRLTEPSVPLLVDGDTERVGLIHAAGDAIVPQVAATFIQAFSEED